MLGYQGQKVKKSDASLLARGFLNLGPAILKHGAIRGIIGGKIPFDPNII